MALKTLFLSLFIVLSAVHLLGEFLIIKKVKTAMLIRYITKPFIMPLLAVFYYFTAAENDNVNWWLFAGIIGGFGGDFFLMIPDPATSRKWFKLGLISFLLGHIFYIVAFIQAARGFRQFQWWSILLAIPFIIYGVIFYPRLTKYTGKMTAPVTVYIIVIVTMGAATAFIWGSGRPEGIMLLMLGALIFMISDTINALNKFAREIRNERLYTMFTYIIGQFLIVCGYLLL